MADCKIEPGEGDAECSSEDESFGQRTPPLTVYLQRILDKYPDGGQILKELVQNADDAGARNVIFMFDQSHYPHATMCADELGKYQGPALYAYNDGVFSDQDWHNIQNPEQSGKKDEPTKTGRFGLGFNSVYHVTDIPSILSGSQLGYLDPRETCFGPGNPGKSWKLDSKRLLQSTDQLKPFMHHIFDINEKNMRSGHYPATIFRFPFREEPSELSKTIYTRERIQELFASYRHDAEISLLYLKSVESVSLYEKQSDSKQPQLLFRVGIAEKDTDNVRKKRREFVEGCKAMEDNVQTCMDFDIEQTTTSESSISKYMTLNLLKRRSVSKELQDNDLKLLPWVSVTIPVNSISSDTSPAGRVFCFLPLPADESPRFPLHVHGYFGLNDNRRGIKWPDGDSEKDAQALWNRKLVQEVFPDAYGRMLLRAIDSEMTPADVYRCWPGKHDTRHQIWNEGVVALVKNLQSERILYSEVDGGKWLTPKEVLLNAEEDAILSDLIQKILLEKHRNVVKLPSNVLHALTSAEIEIAPVTPKLVREAIRGDKLSWIGDEEKLQLLEYIIRDEQVQDVQDIHLLPLRDGSFTHFSTSLPDVFIPSQDMPAEIITNLDHRFAADTLPSTLHEESALHATQLVQFSVDHVLELLKEALPRNWAQSADLCVPWHRGQNGHPGSQWLADMWTWLSHNHRKLPMDQLTDIPLLPIKNETHLVKMRDNKIIFKNFYNTCEIETSASNDWSIPDMICSFLEELGAVIIYHQLPDFIIDHPETTTVIQPAGPDGICNLLETSRPVAIRKMKEIPNEDKDTFRLTLAELPTHALEKHRDFLLHLPIFPDTRGAYIAINNCKRMIPQDYHGIPVDHLKDVFVWIKDESSEEFLKKLGCHKVVEEELLKLYILPHVSYPDTCYNDDQILKLMKWVLERSQYDHDVESVKFVPTGEGTKEAPQNLFDPDDDDLKCLFGQSPLFPVGCFADPDEDLLQHLRRVGFRKPSTITALELLGVASEIHAAEKTEDVLSRSRILFSYISKMSHLLNEQVRYNNITKSLGGFLQEKHWIPVLSSPSNIAEYPSNLSWFGSQRTLFKPRDVAAHSTALLQGSVVPIIDETGLTDEMADTFDWNRELDPHNYIDVQRVAHHLKNLCASFSTGSDPSVYTKTTSRIYAFLNDAPMELVNSIMEKDMRDVCWVWHGQGFTSTDKSAFDGGGLRVKLEPYLFVLPKSSRSYENLLSGAGVNENFPDNILCSVLVSIQKSNQERSKSKGEIQDDLSLVCDILNCISNSHTEEAHVTQDILVPTRNDGSSLELVEAGKCLYVDDDRLLDQYEKSECELPVVHPKLPTATAKHLGLLPLSHYVAPTEEIDFGYDMEGPHETTVDAIRRNLDLYKEGVDIFKELIQNADDAGATEVKFLIDWRTNSSHKTTLLNKDMQSCHGPALWAYNDAQFSESDVKNICQIAAATKKLELEKVGRFGLGFTSVYHLTDVPSIMSGPFIMIFDPRTTHLRERVRAAKPGIKLDLNNDKHKVTVRSFPDQFQPFQDVFGCNISECSNYDHTLFRLPLRGDVDAMQDRANQLSDAIYSSTEKMSELLKLLKTSSDTLLLFTQNVETLSVYTLEDGCNPTETKEVLSIFVERKQQLQRSIGGPSSDLKTERNLLKVAKRFMLPDNVLLQQSSTACDTNTESSMILEIHRKDNLAGKKKPSKKNYTYCVSSCTDTNGAALLMARTKKGREFGIVPCGGVATLLHLGSEGLKPKESNGRAFSFLPLEIETGLPFYVNGAFLLQSNRRQLENTSKATTDLSTEAFKGQWNMCLMTNVICKALFNLLHDLKAAEDIDALEFHTLWPTFEKVHSDFEPIVQGFYDLLIKSSPSVIYNGKRWVGLNSVIFLKDVSDNHPAADAVKALVNQHCNPSKIVAFTEDVLASIYHYRILNGFQDNIYTWARFVETVFFPLLQDDESDAESESDTEDDVVSADHRDVIIQHLLDERMGSEKITNFDVLLRTTACIPVTSGQNNDILRKPSQLVHPNSRVGRLYKEEDRRFPQGDGYLGSDRLHSLTDLGMNTDTLTWDDICERAEVVQVEDGFTDSPFHRSVVLLGIIDEKLRQQNTTNSIDNEDMEESSNGPTPEQIARLQDAPFLPVMEKKDDYPLQWFGRRNFGSAKDVFDAKYDNLLGSVRELLDERKLGSDVMTERLKEFLGLKDKEPQVEDVVMHLRSIVCEDYTADTHSMVTKLCGDVYEFLQKKMCILGEDNQITPDENFQEQVEELRSMKFLFTDGKFVSVSQLAFQFGDHCPPFLYSVPSTLTSYTNLLKLCGVRDNFEPADLFGVLTKLHEMYNSTPLADNDVILAHKMIGNGIDTIVDSVKETSEQSPDTDDGLAQCQECVRKAFPSNSENPVNESSIVAVDENCIIQKADSITYNDMWWDEDQTLNAHHPKLTLRNARVLGIQTARQRSLQGCSTSDGFENDFGQTESLLNRLQGILRDYHHVSDVMKELLQNADDAKATEIHFVYDPRAHGTEKVIHEGKWGPLQKLPALCVFNNRPFSEEDIKGIQRVGVGGKGSDKSTTGRFGIGFNAVYHLTDCPTFISDEEKLCIFDPYVRHVPGATPACPGRMYTCNENFKGKFPDMLTGYLGDKFTLKGSTMFRFPLRSIETALADTEDSIVISNEWYSDKRIRQLLDEFQKNAKDSMFFLKYIEHIRISIIEDDGELHELYSMSSTVTDEDREQRQQLSDHVNLYKDAVDQIPPMTKVYKVTLKDTENLLETWMVAQSVGSDEPFQKHEDRQEQGLKPQLPRGGVAALLQSIQEIKDKASRWHMKRRVYSFLPLPIESTLPVHVNGSFALDSSRRNLAKSTGFMAQGDGSETCLDHPWNKYLVEQVIATAYAHLIQEAKTILPENPGDISNKVVDEYYSVFPTGDYGDWGILKKKTLQYIGTFDLKVLLVKRDVKGEDSDISWHHPNALTSLAFFDNLHSTNYTHSAHNGEIRSFLHSVRFRLIKAPLGVYDAFVDAGVEAKCVTSDEVLKHLGNNPQHVAPKFPVCLNESKYKTHDRLRAVTQYCLRARKNTPDLHQVPLRFTNDNQIGIFTKHEAVFFSTFADLIPEKNELFIHQSIVSLLSEESDIKHLKRSGVIKRFTFTDLKQNLHYHHFPADWKDSPKHVDWTPGKNGHPTKEWLKRLWTFIFDSGESNPDIRWPIIPTTTSTLVTVKKAKTVLHVDSSLSHERRGILKHLLDCPVLSITLLGQTHRSAYDDKYMRVQRKTIQIPTNYGIFLNTTLASTKNHNDVLIMFEYLIEQRNLAGLLNPHDARELLLYFQEGIADIGYLWNKHVLLKLPIFCLADGKLGSIHGYENLHTCDTSMPMDEGVWMLQKSCIFLQPDSKLGSLYGLLHIQPIDEVSIYTRYVIPCFNFLSQMAKEKHMERIKDHILETHEFSTEKEHDEFLAKLQSLQWIPDDVNGFVKQPSFYYEPSNAVFREILQPARMLPKKYADDPEWREFLEKLGFHTAVTEELFLTYANDISYQASGVADLTERDALKKKSIVLLDELKSNSELKNSSFLQAVSTINFIPPEEIKTDLINIFPAYKGQQDETGKDAFTSFKEGAAYADMELAWSVGKVLPPSACVKSEDGKTALGTERSTPQASVMRHIKNVSLKMVKWNCCDEEDRVDPKTRGTLKRVMKAILQYLQGQFNQKTLPAADTLKELPLCLVDNSVLVCANQIVFTLRYEDQLLLRPYLYKANSAQQESHKEMLHHLGAQRRPTLTQLAKVMASIKDECGEKKMHPNEINTSLTALRLLLSDLTKSTSSSSSEAFKEDAVLYLPSANGYLKQSTDLCCADTHLKKNLPKNLGVDFVVDLKQCGIDDSREDTRLLALLPKQLRPHDLGDSMTERPCESNKPCIAGQNCPFLQTIHRCLTAEELQRALMRLLRHENEGARLTQEQSDGIGKLLEVSKLTCVKNLEVELVDNNGKCLSEHPRERMVFMQLASDSDEQHIFLQHSELPVTDCLLYRELSRIILSICGLDMDVVHFSLLREIIACIDLEKMNLLLTKSDIPEYDDETKVRSDPFAPGSKVPEEFIELLDVNPCNKFHKDEIVAFILPMQLPEVAFASQDMDNDNFSSGQEEYYFAKVIKEDKSSEGNATSGMRQHYLIDAGHEKRKKVSATSLYKFRRFKLPNNQAPYNVDEDMGGAEVQGPPRGGLPTSSVEEAKEWITRRVEDAFSLSEDERRAALRRLRFMWHPDKNRSQEELANAGFQFLQQEVERRENPPV